jgi:phage tail-like protein
MVSSADYPLPAFYFKVVFAATMGNSDTSFQEVSGISSEMETEPIVEGGNQYTRQLPKSLKHSNLVLKRGIADMSSPLVVWCRAVLETNFMEPIVPTLVSVYLMNEQKVPVRAWTFTDAYPVKWNVEAFNSTKNEVAIETIELSYMSSSRTL